MLNAPHRLLFRLLSFLGLSLAAPVALGAQEARPGGEWRLALPRPDSSDKPNMRPFGAMGSWSGNPAPRDTTQAGGRRSGGEGGGMRQGRGGYGGGRRLGGVSEKDIARARQTLDLARNAPLRISFAGDSSVTLTDSIGTVSTLRIDGKQVTDKVQDGGDVETRARWNGESLVLERKVSGGGKVTETYGLGLDGTKLIAFVEVSGTISSISLTRQYQRGDSAAGEKPSGALSGEATGEPAP